MNSVIEQASSFIVTSDVMLLASVFAAVALFVLGALALFPTAPNLEKRLGAAADGTARTSLSYGDKSSRSLLRRLERSLTPQDDTKRSAIRRRLLQAGYYAPHAVTAYYALRLGLALLLPVLTLVALPAVTGTLPVQQMYFGAMAALAVGFFGPAFLLARRIGERQRLVREAFPDTLDLLLVCVEAGLSLNAALVRVATELRHAFPLLCEHFHLVALEMQAGSSREAALRRLSERVGIDEVKSLVSLLVQSEAMGVSVAQTLRLYAAEMRRKRQLLAEEHANKLPVRMVLPLAGMVMPAFLIIIVSPAGIRISQALLPALGG